MRGKNGVNPVGLTSILTKHRHNIYPSKSGSYSCAMLNAILYASFAYNLFRKIKFCFEVVFTDVRVGDKLIMKKNHPCGCNSFTVLRVGMDFKIKCDGCEREIMQSRSKTEKNIRKIIHKKEENNA